MDNIVPNEFLSRVLGIDSNMCPSIEYKHHFCSLAFYHIIAKSYSLGYKRIVIFEDDFKFYNTEDYEGIGNIEKALNQLSTMDAWDIIYFGGYPSGNFEKISNNIIKVETILAMHGVGINKSGMEKILQYFPFIDSALDGWISNKDSISKYLVYPMSSYQKSDYSDLDTSGKTPNKQHWESHYLKI
jgi:hypothetical protein